MGTSCMPQQSCVPSRSPARGQRCLRSGSTNPATSTGERASCLGSGQGLRGGALPLGRHGNEICWRAGSGPFSTTYSAVLEENLRRVWVFLKGYLSFTLAVAQSQQACYVSSVGCVSQELNKNPRKTRCGL